MLEWILALFIVILGAVIWTVSKYFGTQSEPDALLQELGITRRQTKEKCVSDRRFSVDGADALPSDREDTSKVPAVALICKPSALANYLQKHCRSFSNFTACTGWTWRASGFLQTVYNACWPYESRVHFVRDHLQLTDDGLVALDWAVSVAGASYQKRRRTSSNSTSPILLIIPNSFGKITRNVLKLCEVALSHGYLPVVFNRRSHNATPLTTLKLQQFGDPGDLREAVRYVRYRQPVSRLYAVSESTGSGLLLSYLGECGSSSYVTAAACLSPVFRCQSWFENGPIWPLQWVLVMYQKMCLSRYRTVLEEAVHTGSLFSCCSLRGLEEVLFCHPPGPKGAQAQSGSPSSSTGAWEAYWERNEPLRDVDEVAIPVLSICAQDDSVRGHPHSTLPLELFESNPHFFLLLTTRGGHCGFNTQEGSAFSGGGSPGTSWSHRALLEFFRATTDFIAAEERAKQSARRRGLGGSTQGKAFRHRSVSTCKRMPACSHSIHTIYNWQRSYTR
ncbi:hypothetical protein UPYG_G00199540 [Umbra pygmaea]|uniref:Protein ABHD15 n=1 Tax=Umbra pygmaea TaxID=75934 RepID=A0ABD0X5S3_UMBPY